MLPEEDLLRQAFLILKKWRSITHGRVSNISQVLLVESALGSLEALLPEA